MGVDAEWLKTTWPWVVCAGGAAAGECHGRNAERQACTFHGRCILVLFGREASSKMNMGSSEPR